MKMEKILGPVKEIEGPDVTEGEAAEGVKKRR